MTRKKLLLPVVAAMTFFLGFESAGYQLAVLSIAEEFNVSAGMMGGMVAAQYAAIMLAPLLMGRLGDMYGKKKVLLFAIPAFALGCLLAALSKGTLSFMGSVFVIGGGFAVCECISGAALMDTYPENGDRYMNLTQFLFSIGAVVSPLITQRCMDAGLSWRTPFWICFAAYIVIFPLFYRTEISRPAPSAETKKGGLLQIACTPGFLGLLLAMVAYVGVETGVVYFADSLFVLALDAPRLGSYAISAFWLCMGISRLIFSLIRYDAAKAVMGCQIGLCLTLVALSVCKLPYASVALCALAGAAAGPTWPLIFSLAARRLPEDSGAASSLISFSSGLGGALSPVLMGFLAQSMGLRISYATLALMGGLGFVVMRLSRRRTLKQ